MKVLKKTINGPLRSARKTADIYIGRCDPDITPKTISEYVVNEFKVKPIACIHLDTKIKFSCAFKLTIELSDRDKLLDLDHWPEGMIVRKFFNKR